MERAMELIGNLAGLINAENDDQRRSAPDGLFEHLARKRRRNGNPSDAHLCAFD
jgi:hypothetical protein